MEKINVLPQNFYKFFYDKQLTEKILELIKSLPYIRNEHNHISSLSLNHMKEFNDLHDWFNDCLAKVKNDLQLPFTKIVITETWSNKSFKNEWHHGHIHFNSFLSGVFYLNTSDTGNTWFSIDNFWYDFFLIENNLAKDFNADKRLVIHKESPEMGKLILFPSKIFHSVDNHEDKEPRFSIAFNTFPDMLILKNTYYLNITNTPKHCKP